MDDFLRQLPHVDQTDIRLFAAAVSASSNGVVITDNSQPDEPIIYCNKAFEYLTGYTNKEIIGHNCRFLQDGDRDQEARNLLREAIAKGEHCQVEIRNYKKDGRLIWNELMISPVKDQDGNITNFIGIQNDITRRKEAEKALAAEKSYLEERVLERTQDLQYSEAYLSSIIETIRESLVVLNEHMQVLSVNDHFCRFFKIAQDDIKGKVLFEHNDGRWNLPELKNLLINVLPHNNPFEGFEIESEFPKIGRKLLVLNARQVTLKGKYQNRILLAIEDITERREIEQRKEDFISIASHEMKTPLTSIKGNLQLLQRKAQRNNDTQYSEGFATASKSILRLEKLIYDLLDVSKIQSGKVGFSFTTFNFTHLINEAVEGILATTQTHNIIVTGGSSQIEITADYGRLEQVLLNLLGNAIKYSPDGNSVKVHISILPGYLKVSITDTGVGIHERDHKRIFERFYRADQIAEKFPGVGIGLYVCNEIIKEHKGTLWVESAEGKGSVFSFTIPVNRS
ncbi:PAS domain-containing sensor histidine kinase [Mucilaginibacter glaciei]|uniref:histidine kinase n=1 Tax=Mucilaginibacter glaciei TaxID=2772109 RepID=A0A926NQS1_9SPHI|nr:PAS domain S-box protein [Mucilaginibacter glaciei]MBD1392947.1 PAS domain S-box protein [Mucilaginibacter glaciei]